MSLRIGLALIVTGALLAAAMSIRSGEPPAFGARADATPVNLSVVFDDMNGEKVDLEAFGGQPLLINLWATWCGPCRLEMPQLVGLQNRFRDRGLVILGISVDDPPAAIRAFAAEYGANYPMLVGIGQNRFLEQLGYRGVLPFSALVGADGRIVDRITGLKTTADWERRILRTLGAP